MVLRCSLLGHDYGDPEVEREREEQGSEVVVTVREYEECSRCGEQNVLSENTEVTSLPPGTQATDVAVDTDATADPDTTHDESTAEIEPDDAGEPESTPTSNETAASSGSDTTADTDTLETDPDHPTDEHGEPITDDAEILEDEDEDDSQPSDREHGEWPESDDVGPPVGEQREPTAWPDETDAESDATADHDTEELSYDDSTTSGASDTGPTDDAVFVDADSTDAGRYGYGSGREQGSNSGEGEGVTDSGTGIASPQSAPTPGEESIPEDVPSEFYCPRCDFVAPEERGSLRPGDICPNCRRGYLGERER